MNTEEIIKLAGTKSTNDPHLNYRINRARELFWLITTPIEKTKAKIAGHSFTAISDFEIGKKFRKEVRARYKKLHGDHNPPHVLTFQREKPDR